MNNKGFAITTIIFGTFVLFLLLLLSMLKLLSNYRKNMEILTENNNGIRDTMMLEPIHTNYASKEELLNSINKPKLRGLYCFKNNTCEYITTVDVK